MYSRRWKSAKRDLDSADPDVFDIGKLTVHNTSRQVPGHDGSDFGILLKYCKMKHRECETYTYDLIILIMQCWFGCSCEEHFDDHDANGGDGDEIMVRPGWLELSNGVRVSLSFFKSSRLWGCLGFWRDTFRLSRGVLSQQVSSCLRNFATCWYRGRKIKKFQKALQKPVQTWTNNPCHYCILSCGRERTITPG